MSIYEKPKGELLSHQFSIRVVKGDTEFNEEEFAKRIAKFIVGFLDCYPHYIIKQPFKDDQETWIFKFWIEKQ